MLVHTNLNRKYHIVFEPKFRRKAFFEDKRREILGMPRRLCEWKQMLFVLVNDCLGHIHISWDSAGVFRIRRNWIF